MIDIKDPRFKKLLRDIQTTWQAIGPDCEQCAEECGESMTEEGRVEVCIDADRMTTFAKGSEDSHDYVTELYEKHGYEQVMSCLARHTNL